VHHKVHWKEHKLRRQHIKQALALSTVDINAQATYGGTALITACGKGMTEVAKLLVERGADIHAKDNDSCTALFLAVKNNHPSLAAYLRTIISTGR
jgi:ankyrin repeat protein